MSCSFTGNVKSTSSENGKTTIIDRVNGQVTVTVNGVIKATAVFDGTIKIMDDKVYLGQKQLTWDDNPTIPSTIGEGDAKQLVQSVPAILEIKIQGDVGTITAHRGDISVSCDKVDSIKTQNGDVKVTCQTVSVVETVNGDIKVHGDAGQTSSANGNVKVGQTATKNVSKKSKYDWN